MKNELNAAITLLHSWNVKKPGCDWSKITRDVGEHQENSENISGEKKYTHHERDNAVYAADICYAAADIVR